MTMVKRRTQRDLPVSWVTAPIRAPFAPSLGACAFSPRRSTKVRPLQGRRGAGAGSLVGSGNDQAPVESGSVAPLKWSTEEIDYQHLVSAVKFNDVGLVPAVAQQWDTGEVLMVAWMNADSIRETMRGGLAVYYSRSRKRLWRKGDTSGQIQAVRDVLLDCDGDTILLKVDQLGVACHTGRRSCFFTAYRPPDGKPIIVADPMVNPEDLYKADQQKQ